MAEPCAKLVFVDDVDTAVREIGLIGSDPGAFMWIVPKAIHVLIKITDLSPYIANILKQEMLGKGGDAAVHRGVADFSVERSDVLLMGTLSQYRRLVDKLKVQSVSLVRISVMIQEVLSSFDKGKPDVFECGRFRFLLGERTYIMAILNATPDSFSDGGSYNDPDSALCRISELISLGADMIDIGGESTRPGHQPVSEEAELTRVMPILERAVSEFDVPFSIDTTKLRVAEEAVNAGACVINDIWGLQKEPRLAETAAKANAGIVMMHNRDSRDPDTDIMTDIIRFFGRSISIAENAGLQRSRMMVDPGIGFGKTLEQNLDVIRRLREMKTLLLPVLVGTSRKSMIGNVLDTPVGDRVEGTAVTVALSIANGADFVRVHDAGEIARVCRMTDAIVRKK